MESIGKDKHFLGWAIMSVVLDHAGKDGPIIEDGPMQRDLDKATVKMLYDMGGKDEAKTLLRHEPQHALVFGATRDIVDITSLCKNLDGPFRHVVWKNGATAHQIIRYAGQHRTAALQMVWKGAIDELKRIEKRLIKGAEKSEEKLKEQKAEIVARLHAEATWLVAFYDEGDNC